MGSKRYTEEFKVEAVRQVVEHGHSVAEVASRRIVRGLGFERLLFPKADVQTRGNWTKLRSANGQKPPLVSRTVQEWSPRFAIG